MKYRHIYPAVIVVMILCAASPAPGESAGVAYNRDVRPILAGKCFTCHGPDEGTREADLRLDLRAGAIAERDGLAAIVPGDADASLLIERITDEDESTRMPPVDSGKPLSDSEIETLRKWIAAGAKYETHWALEPLTQTPQPAVKHGEWVRTPIDRFVLAKLEQHGLSPSPEADRYTLIRRVYLDLLGVLPGIEAADAFDSDTRPDAYERMVDRALASPRFGERWGRHWLDQARYADSHGYTIDNARTMWPYRDWVIDALNRDMPFDQFTIEQLAGDLLPPPSKSEFSAADLKSIQLQRQVATGFHRNTLINTEGGVKPDQFRDEQVKDRVDTTGVVWLGLTIGCAKCHSHKYDPISQTEYYELYAFFNSTADNNSVAPVIKAPTPQQQAALRNLDARHVHLQKQLDDDPTRNARQAKWEAALAQQHSGSGEGEGSAAQGLRWAPLKIEAKSNGNAVFTALDDGSLLAGGDNVIADHYQITAKSPLKTIRSVRLEVLTHDELPQGGPGRADNGNFLLAEAWLQIGDDRELRFGKAAADHSQPNFDVAGAIDNNEETGWAVNGSPEGGPNHNRTAWFLLAQPLVLKEGDALTLHLQHHRSQRPYNIGRLRVSVSAEEWIDHSAKNELAKLAATPVAKRTAAAQKQLDEAFLRGDAQLGPIFAELQEAARQRTQLQSQVASTMVMRELDKPRFTHLQHRGDFLQPGDQVNTDVPDVLPPLKEVDKPARIASRLEFAHWLVRNDNPLTPRVRVNRLWMHLFGSGLVETENDFGTQGSLPSHPELLDWLAAEHIRQGWSTKHLLRLILTSATYRQTSAMSQPAGPNNRLLWRQNRLRVEGEIVRDLALSASGMLSANIGGPSVYPPQPEGVYDFTQQAKSWPTSMGEDRYRRGMYTFYYRSAPYPMLSTFDAPKFNQTYTRRDRSNTPLQSLTVANDEAMFELTQALARRLLLHQPQASVKDRAHYLFRLCMTRPPSETEAICIAEFYTQQRVRFQADAQAAQEIAPDNLPKDTDSAEAAAWVATARVVLNLDEFITRE